MMRDPFDQPLPPVDPQAAWWVLWGVAALLAVQATWLAVAAVRARRSDANAAAADSITGSPVVDAAVVLAFGLVLVAVNVWLVDGMRGH